mmetsp:Transcript_22655/g.51081  ORF Transcript_22655/g.51081 Transcript_22655/m.51081 type:complete len:412 (-) Transcript_22655:9-1244(-)
MRAVSLKRARQSRSSRLVFARWSSHSRSAKRIGRVAACALSGSVNIVMKAWRRWHDAFHRRRRVEKLAVAIEGRTLKSLVSLWFGLWRWLLSRACHTAAAVTQQRKFRELSRTFRFWRESARSTHCVRSEKSLRRTMLAWGVRSLRIRDGVYSAATVLLRWWGVSRRRAPALSIAPQCSRCRLWNRVHRLTFAVNMCRGIHATARQCMSHWRWMCERRVRAVACARRLALIAARIGVTRIVHCWAALAMTVARRARGRSHGLSRLLLLRNSLSAWKVARRMPSVDSWTAVVETGATRGLRCLQRALKAWFDLTQQVLAKRVIADRSDVVMRSVLQLLSQQQDFLLRALLWKWSEASREMSLCRRFSGVHHQLESRFVALEQALGGQRGHADRIAVDVSRDVMAATALRGRT